MKFIDFRIESLTADEWKYATPYRSRDIKAFHKESGFAVLITEIRKLKRKHELFDFRKVSDNEPVERAQAPVIVRDPKYVVTLTPLTSAAMIDDYLKCLFTDAKMKERDIEDLFEYSLYEKGLYIERQLDVGNRRVDVLVRKGEVLFVFELKRGAATIWDVNQLAEYVQDLKTTEKGRVRGVLLCAEYGQDVDQALVKWRNRGLELDAAVYTFSIDLEFERFGI